MRYRAACVAVVVAALTVSSATASATTPTLALCGNSGAPTTTVQHVMVVMLENQSYPAVVGNQSKAPYENGTLATQCGLATDMFGATHTSAANYLAMSAGTYSSSTVAGCGSVAACSSSADNLYRQLDYSTAGWKAYEESMPSSCFGGSAPAYKIGHNPPLFYGLAACARDDVGVPDLTAQSGALWNDLSNQTLPAFSFVTPNLNNDGEGATGLAGADSWLQKFLGTVQKSAAYQSGSTVVIVTYDEGTGSDAVKDENCSNKALDLAGSQPSCHVPAFVVYPWASGSDGAFFDHYSVTRTVDELFGLPLLAGAATAPSLIGHFGLAVDGAPTASLSVACTALTCTLDGSSSTAPGSRLTDFQWTFGDGARTDTGQGDTATHTYAAAGTYPVTLVVTNALGTPASAAAPAQPGQVQKATPIAFVGMAATAANATRESVKVPAAVSAGDGLILVASSAVATPQTGPPGWALVQTASSALMFSSVWQRVATAADAGAAVTVTFGSTLAKGSLQLVAYAGTSPAGPVLGSVAVRTGVATTSSFASPSMTVQSTAPSSQPWLLSCWSARSAGSTGWSLQTGQKVRSSVTGSGGAHISSVIADSAGPVAPGPAGAFTGTTGQPASADVAWTLLLAPAS